MVKFPFISFRAWCGPKALILIHAETLTTPTDLHMFINSDQAPKEIQAVSGCKKCLVRSVCLLYQVSQIRLNTSHFITYVHQVWKTQHQGNTCYLTRPFLFPGASSLLGKGAFRRGLKNQDFLPGWLGHQWFHGTFCQHIGLPQCSWPNFPPLPPHVVL